MLHFVVSALYDPSTPYLFSVIDNIIIRVSTLNTNKRSKQKDSILLRQYNHKTERIIDYQQTLQNTLVTTFIQ